MITQICATDRIIRYQAIRLSTASLAHSSSSNIASMSKFFQASCKLITLLVHEKQR